MERYGPPKRRRREEHLNAYDKAEIEGKVEDTSLVDLGITSRVANSLEERGIYNACQLAGMTLERLREVPNIGEQTITDCRRILDRLGIDHPNWRLPVRKKRKK